MQYSTPIDGKKKKTPIDELLSGTGFASKISHSSQVRFRH
jgi:hypothetical protein